MDKSEKLKVYEQKDYTELIEFPVELVGKDGIVRRYTYEESLLVYQKRIESAYQRYRDQEIASAEVDHCCRRIDQIKRSWRVVASRRVAAGSADYAARFEESAAAECRAFVREFFGKALADRVATDEEPIPIYLSLVQSQGPMKVFHVSLAGRKGGHLLYAFTFSWEPEKDKDEAKDKDADARPAREQYSEMARVFAMTPDGEDVEHLLAVREGKEFGFLLTGSAGVVPPKADEAIEGSESAKRPVPKRGAGAARARVQAMLDEDAGNAEAHYAMAVLMAGEEDDAGALEELKSCVELQPFTLEAYRMLSSVAERLGCPEEVEPYLLQARHYFPDDARIHWDLATLLLRAKRWDDAAEPLARAVALDPTNRRAASVLEALTRARARRADPWKKIEPLLADRVRPAGPGNLALLAAAFATSIALSARALEPMAGTLLLCAVQVALILHGARLARLRRAADR